MRDLLTPLLRQPAFATSYTLRDWGSVIRLARNANLLARLAHDLRHIGAFDAVPAAPRQHLLAAQRLAQRQHTQTLAEIAYLRDALTSAGLRLVLLKGAAYVAADLPLAKGRLFGDIDLIFPRAQLPQAESILLSHGWAGSHVSAYDERYYRRWMHELPPLRHNFRGSTLDVHHNILPSTARQAPDAALLLEAAQEVAALPGVHVLAPQDMLLHSACHLFHEGELDNGLRDLCDLDKLFRHFIGTEAKASELIARAQVLHLQGPLRHAASLSQAILGTPLPAALQRFIGEAPPSLAARLLHKAYLRALRPHHPELADFWTPPALLLLYLRGHWLRMPPWLLARHLGRKAWQRWSGRDEDAAEKPVPTPLA